MKFKLGVFGLLALAFAWLATPFPVHAKSVDAYNFDNTTLVADLATSPILGGVSTENPLNYAPMASGGAIIVYESVVSMNRFSDFGTTNTTRPGASRAHTTTTGDILGYDLRRQSGTSAYTGAG